MIRMAATDVRKAFSETLNKVSYGKDRIVIHRNEKDLAVIVPLEDVELLEMIEDKVDLMLVEEAMRDDDPNEAVDLDTFLAEFDPE
ncbi:type II toxin-antitoxin system Phd/YefM family antitoxin [bacterium]|nr:type II toxin-antitoxin system Phd/YefM family antitoxin [bacterium]